MDRAARRGYVRAHALPLAALVPGYALLTALRDFRDDFAAELWVELGHPASPAIFAISEVPVTIVVLCALAALTLLRDNLGALLAIHAGVLAGALLLVATTIAFRLGLLGPVGWMVAVGIGIHVAYAPFGAVLFDRMIALGRSPGNAAFLIHIADSFGYAASVGLLLLRAVTGGGGRWLAFFQTAALATGALLAVTTGLSAWWFARRYRTGAGDVTPSREPA